jgi:RHS repeat-associated protein
MLNKPPFRHSLRNALKIFLKNRTGRVVCLMLLASIGITQANAQVATPPAAYPVNMPVSFVRTWDALAPETNPNTLTTRALHDVRQATQYFDGLGRPLQTVVKQGSLLTYNPTNNPAFVPVSADLVNAQVYDQQGREVYKYLPFAASTTDGVFKGDPFQQQSLFYSDANANSPIKGQGDTYYYGKTEFEASPLSRVTKSTSPGNSFVGASRGIAIKRWHNTLTDDVKIWTVTNVVNSLGTYAATSYPAAVLDKTITVDEHGKQMIEFADKEGKVILKKIQLTATADNGSGSGYTGWLCTYYIYDNLNNLRCVIQPAGVAALPGASWITTASILTDQCFRYEYDQRNRVIRKKIPGAGEVWMVYDALDRLVMTQDANMRTAAQKKWAYTVYDDKNRPIATGLLTDNTNYNNLAFHLSAAYTNTSGYPNLALYTTEELTRTFYDNYLWLASNGNPFSASRYTGDDAVFLTPDNSNYPYPQALTQSTAIKGLVTGVKTKVLGTSSQYLYSISYYDDKGRVIQAQSTTVSGIIFSTTQYNFAGQPLINYSIVSNSNVTAGPVSEGVKTTYTYDDLGRSVSISKRIYASSGYNTGETTIVQNEYDVLGRLKRKKLSPAYNSNAGLESENFDYNIRGWMLGMNRDYAKDVNNTNWFGFDLGYDKTSNGIIGGQAYTTPQYNGNIEGMVWKSRGDGEKRKYDFTYDAANRILTADFNQYTSSTFNKTANIDFSLSNMSYDANGNILSMYQKGLKLNSSSLIDQLTYTYQAGSNKLQKVTDAVNDNTSKLGDFKYDAATKTATDYTYDDNGNLITDVNKKISSIVYNYLNLPSLITITGKGTISYTYDASGNKIKKVTTDNTIVPTKTTTTLYLGNAVYENDVLQFIGHEEGRIRFRPSDATYQYDYMLKDHLGNVRAVLTEEVKTDMYPAATMETATATTEETYYSNLPATRVAPPVGYPANTPAGNAKVAKVSAAVGSNKIGPAITLKVMAGDKFNVAVNSWWKSTSTPVNPAPGPLADLVSALNNSVGAITGTHGGATIADLQTSNVFSPSANNFLTGQTYNAARPKAYINWVLFDEHFNYVSSSSGFEQVGASDAYTPHSRANLSIDKSGYLYIYTSNASDNIDVFFDNLQVTHVRGPLVEETHYYPWGLTMAGISSRALLFGGAENKYKYNKASELQNKEFSDGSGLELYATNFRSLDPQLGRWWQIDPKPDHAQSLFSAMNNNPELFNDPLGDTVRHSFRTGFLGIFGKKVTVDYENGRFNIAGTNTAYTGKTRNYQNSLLSDLKNLSSNSSTKDMMGDLVGNTRIVQIKNGGSAENGGASFEIKSAVADPGKPLIVNYSVGKSYRSNDVNQGGANALIPGFVGLAHEFGHVQDYLTNGNTNFLKSNIWYTSSIDNREIARSEIFATDVENRLRANLGLPLREFYSADKGKGITEGPILAPGTRTNANLGLINAGYISNPYFLFPIPIPVTY